MPFRNLQTLGRRHKVACEKFFFHTAILLLIAEIIYDIKGTKYSEISSHLHGTCHECPLEGHSSLYDLIHDIRSYLQLHICLFTGSIIAFHLCIIYLNDQWLRGLRDIEPVYCPEACLWTEMRLELDRKSVV